MADDEKHAWLKYHVVMDASLLALLLKLVTKHERAVGLVETLALVAVDHCRLLERHLERCARESCEAAATVRHLTLGLKCCDACAARLVVKASTLNMITHVDAVMVEEMWVDLPDATQVRRLQDYLDVVKRDEEPSMPEDPQLLQ